MYGVVAALFSLTVLDGSAFATNNCQGVTITPPGSATWYEESDSGMEPTYAVMGGIKTSPQLNRSSTVNIAATSGDKALTVSVYNSMHFNLWGQFTAACTAIDGTPYYDYQRVDLWGPTSTSPYDAAASDIANGGPQAVMCCKGS